MERGREPAKWSSGEGGSPSNDDLELNNVGREGVPLAEGVVSKEVKSGGRNIKQESATN